MRRYSLFTSHPIYRKLVTAVIRNYILGSFLAVVGVGGSLIFSTLHVSRHDAILLVVTLFISLIVMMISEFIAFTFQLRPIRRALTVDIQSFETVYRAYEQVHRLPLLSVYRIMGPHWLGVLIPGALISWFEIHAHLLHLPISYVWLAVVGSFVVAAMHAVIEFFLTNDSVKPVLAMLQDTMRTKYGRNVALTGRVIVPVQRKFQVSVIVIGVLPLLLFVLASEIRFSDSTGGGLYQYWTFAAAVLCIGVAFSLYAALLLSRDVKHPIQTLESLMLKVQDGRFDVKANDIYSDEFSRLVAGFNQMVQGLAERDMKNNQLTESYFATLAVALDARDEYTAGHSVRVAEYAVAIGRRLGMDDGQLSLLRKSALLHDIGKIGIRDDVLLKDGKLTDEEFDIIKQHPVIGESIIRQVQPAEAMAELLPGIRSHHERIDGRGYPDGLSGETIPLFGRILAVADAYDAMTSDRPYRRGMSQERAMSILYEGRGTQWDAAFVDAFIAIHNSVETAYTQVKDLGDGARP